MAGGLLVQSLFSIGAAEDDRFEVYGSAGKLTVDRHESLAVELSGPSRGRRLAATRRELGALARGAYAMRKLRRPQAEPSYALALARFAAAARANRPTAPDFLDGLRSLAVIEAAEESARSGRAAAPSLVGADLAHS
jgi:predicted dehydrogenase